MRIYDGFFFFFLINKVFVISRVRDSDRANNLGISVNCAMKVALCADLVSCVRCGVAC